jgi:hypothetical protein
MSFPNPDNYARDCECSATGSAPLPDDYFRTIPAPIVHIDAGSAVPTLKVSYIPTNTRSTWLTSNTEVWVFAYKKAKYNGGATPRQRYGRFVHPVDTTRAATTSPFYGGSGGAVDGFTYHTEFPFLNGTAIPDPYVHVPLTGFSPLEFFRTRTSPGTAGTQRQVIEGDFPIAGTANSDQVNYVFNKKLFNCYGYGSYYNGGKGGRTVKLQLRFVIPNPDTTSTKFNKIMGPPSDTIYCLPKYSDTAQALVKAGSIDGIRITL